MDKVLGKVYQTRANWWQAFKLGANLKGYDYYKPPPEIKYRYPAPGSVPHDNNSYPHLYKKHYKTPYRDSPYNIQKKEKVPGDENTEISASSIPTLDPNDPVDRLLLTEQQPDTYGVKILCENFDKQTEEERRQDLWALFESVAKQREEDTHNFNPWLNDLDQDYFPRQFVWRERGLTGLDNDPVMKEIFVELEYLIENTIGYNRIQFKEMDMYKGTVKKWQVLDDSAYDREQVEKIQAAIRAPLPEELELYQEKHSRPMTLPVNNTNVSNWRDEQRAIDTGHDFDPQFLEYDRERRKKYYLERYDKPKELAE